MPTLLQINSVVNTGSTGRIAEQLGQMALARGWNSYIAYGRGALDSSSRLIRIGGKSQVYTHWLLSRLFDRHGEGSGRATRQFIKEIERIRPDVVHLHNLHGYYLHVPLLLDYLSKQKIPTLVTLHDFWLLTGHCAYIERGCGKWMTGCHDCPRTGEYPAALRDSSARNWKRKRQMTDAFADLVLVPVSRWLAGFVAKSFLQEHPLQVIHNGIDTDVFKPYEGCSEAFSGIDWHKFTILTVATRWTATNGLKEILDLAQMLPSDTQIVMVGVTDSQKALLPSKVIGIGKTEDISHLLELYTRADVVFNASTEVTFGLVTAESLACGTPVIVLRDTAGEEIADAETGYVVGSIREIPPLIQTIRRKASNDLSRLCRQRVLEHFDARIQYGKYFELYEKMRSCRLR